MRLCRGLRFVLFSGRLRALTACTAFAALLEQQSRLTPMFAVRAIEVSFSAKPVAGVIDADPHRCSFLFLRRALIQLKL